MGAGGMWEEIVALGVPRLSPGALIRALEEAIIVVRALSGGGDPVTFDGEFYNVTGLTPAAAPTPPMWIGAGGPKGLVVTGRLADGWVPPHLADWRSTLVAESRPIIDDAAASAGRSPDDVGTIYLVSGRITRDLLPETRDGEGRWIGGGVMQWVEELTFAVLEHGATAFNYLVSPGDSISGATLDLGTKSCPPSAKQSRIAELRQPTSEHTLPICRQPSAQLATSALARRRTASSRRLQASAVRRRGCDRGVCVREQPVVLASFGGGW
jgi:Luciferase-like monooxygenase